MIKQGELDYEIKFTYVKRKRNSDDKFRSLTLRNGRNYDGEQRNGRNSKYASSIFMKADINNLSEMLVAEESIEKEELKDICIDKENETGEISHVVQQMLITMPVHTNPITCIHSLFHYALLIQVAVNVPRKFVTVPVSILPCLEVYFIPVTNCSLCE